MLIAIDFDGTVVESRFPDVGPEMPGAAQALLALVHMGHDLMLWTCREDCRRRAYLSEAVAWFADRGIPLAGVNEAPEKYELLPGGRKPHAKIFVDDRNVGGFVGWDRVLEIIRSS